MADMAEDQTALELNTALTDDLLLLVLRCLGPHDLHRSAAPVCKRWRALALGELLWRARLPVELASPAGRPPPAVVRWFRVFQKNLLDNPCFLLSQQIMEHPHNMESPWQSRSVDRKTFVWEDDAVPGDPHDVAQVPRPLRPYSDSFLHLFDRTRVHTEGVQRPRAILPPRHWAEVSQAVDLVNALRVGGCGLAEAVRYLDAGAPLRLSVYCGRSSWTTGNRNTFQFEVGVIVDDGIHPVPPMDARAALADPARGDAAVAWYGSGILDYSCTPGWSRVQVEVPASVCRGRNARRAVVILRARSYPALFGGMFAAPELTFVPPMQREMFDAHVQRLIDRGA